MIKTLRCVDPREMAGDIFHYIVENTSTPLLMRHESIECYAKLIEELQKRSEELKKEIEEIMERK